MQKKTFYYRIDYSEALLVPPVRIVLLVNFIADGYGDFANTLAHHDVSVLLGDFATGEEDGMYDFMNIC